MKVPVSGPLIYPEDIELVVQAAKEGWFTEGKYCARFARKLEQYTGFKHCVLCNSGSSANLLAVTTALRLSTYKTLNHAKPQIITCATGFPTTIFPIIQCGAIPLFVDIDLQTLNIDIGQTAGAMLDPNASGIIVAHTLGFPFNEPVIVEEAKRWEMFVISDCSDALGAMIDGKHVGIYSDMATCSFFPAHHICTGEGGAVFTNDDKIAEMLERFSSWGRDCHCLPGQDNSCGIRFEGDYGELPHGYDHKYVFSEIGYNLKMTELSGALGLAQMEHIEEFIARRRYNFWKILSHVDYWGKKFLVWEGETSCSPFGFPLLLKEEHSARDLAKFLQERGIESRPIFAGNILRHPVMERISSFSVWDNLDGKSMPESDYVMEHGLWIGLSPALSDEQIGWEIKALNEYIQS